MTSDEAIKHVSSVYQDLSLRQPNLKLVYITPEKLSASGKLNSALANLHSRGLLDRLDTSFFSRNVILVRCDLL